MVWNAVTPAKTERLIGVRSVSRYPTKYAGLGPTGQLSAVVSDPFFSLAISETSWYLIGMDSLVVILIYVNSGHRGTTDPAITVTRDGGDSVEAPVFSSQDWSRNVSSFQGLQSPQLTRVLSSFSIIITGNLRNINGTGKYSS